MLQLNDRKATTLASRRPPERRWAPLRLVLGFAQVFGASLGATLLLQTGVTKGALLAVTLRSLHHGERPALRWQAAPMVRAVARRSVAVGLAALGLVSCLKLPDPIERDIQSVKDRSVPRGGRLIPSYGTGARGQVLRAAWEIETDMAWNAYASWVAARLPEFQVRANDAESLRLTRSLEGTSTR